MQASRPKIEYVLFDMDGLMIDSEGMFTKVINEILRPYGKQMTWDIKAGCMGLPELASAKHLLSFFPDIPLTVESCLAQKNEMLDKMWPTVNILPGVRKLVHHLKTHNIPIAVATSSRRHKYELKITNLWDVFGQFEGKVVCSDDKQFNMRGKPNPDIFITAAREMLGRNVGHPEEECTTDHLQERAQGLVFEDSLPGVQAGKRADMSVIWVPDPNLLNVEYSGTEKPDQMLKSLEDFVPEEWGLPPYGPSNWSLKLMRGYHIRIRVHRKQESSKAEELIPGNLFSRLPAQKPKPTQRPRTPPGIPKNDYRFGPIRIDWMDMEDAGSSMGHAKKNKDQGHGTAQATFIPRKHTKTGSMNLPEGVVHIFRDSASILSSEALEATASASTISSNAECDGVMVGVLAVPSWMTPSDFLSFVAPASEGMSHIRIIRDTAPNRSIVVIKFSTVADACEFSEAYNGKPFDPMQPEICHVAHVLSVEIQHDDLVSQAISRLSSSQGSMYELPTCPVCLERMDSAVTGLVTVPCSHTFHCMCLCKWGDSRCPVCRYSQNLLSSHPPSFSSRSSIPIPFANPSTPSLSTCSSCSSTTNLWICLICGNIGCGRYGRAHAQSHYQATTHLYALELETQRVWDYAGDGYVHRLIQNKSDGKLVELPSVASSATAGVTNREGNLGPSQADALTAEKIEAIGIEYSYLLTSQLDSQRSYYEDQLAEMNKQIDEMKSMMELLRRDMERGRKERKEEDERRRKEEESRLAQVVQERDKADQRAQKLTQLARKLEKELKDERAVGEGLLQNLVKMREQVESAKKDKDEDQQKICDLEDQLRDVMFFLQARDKIENGDESAREAAGGSIEMHTPVARRKKKK